MTISQANMRLSAVAGTAFIDFSAADVLTDHIGKILTVKDSAGKVLVGYIKAAGTGETLSGEALADTGFAGVTKASAKVVSGITKANPGVVTFAADHGFANGDVIYFSALDEMTELNTQYWQLQNNAGNTFELAVVYGGASLDTSGYGAAEVTGGEGQRTTFISWITQTGWCVGVDGAGALTGGASKITSDSANIYQTIIANGLLYYSSFDIIAWVSGVCFINISNLTYTLNPRSEIGTYTAYYTGGTNSTAGIRSGQNGLGVDNFSVKQVLTPSATGVTIVSTPGGATYNWTYQETGFNYNDPAGYEYLITNQRAIFANYYRQMRAA